MTQVPIPAFALNLPPKMRFGRGEAIAAIPEIMAFGHRIVLVQGKSAQRTRFFLDALMAQGADLCVISCAGEPDLPMLSQALATAAGHNAQCVVAIGGGAALDLGKALAGLLPTPNVDPMDHLEVVGRGLPLVREPLPFVAIPTTAGTGSEATRNAVIGVPDHKRKVSLRDVRMTARLAVIDPSLTDGTPRAITMASGLDAITQVIEPYLSARATPVTDALCQSAIKSGVTALSGLASGTEDPNARDELALVAWQSGVALANTGLGAVHGIAGVLGGVVGAPHGEICGQLLEPVLQALRDRAEIGSTLGAKLAEIEAILIGTLGHGIDGLSDWAHDAGLPRPSQPLHYDDAMKIAEESRVSSSMKASPVSFNSDELLQILRAGGWVAP